jgi:uncharacterized protein
VIIYFDTSALMKLFVAEAHSEGLRQTADQAVQVFVSQLAWVEMCAGLALKQRTGKIAAEIGTQALSGLRQEWLRYGKLAVNEDITQAAGQLASRFALRAYDAVQLASAQRVHQEAGDSMLFCCFDKALNAAAAGLGMRILVAQN